MVYDHANEDRQSYQEILKLCEEVEDMMDSMDYAREVIKASEMKKYPEGTTKEQWEKYELEKAAFDECMEMIKPERVKFNDPIDYQNALEHWKFECSVMAPNKPGYHIANND